VVRINPAAGPAGARATTRERLTALRDVWTVVLVFLVVMGGIYSGAFTPTEGAGIGAVGMFLIAVLYGGMRWRGFIDTLLETAMTSAMIFVILLGAGVLNAFLGFSWLPSWTAELFQNSGLPPYLIVVGIIARDVPMIDTFRGVVPFLMSDLVRLTLVVALPTISLMLPRLFGG
jgi:C4-dicarboxylate transporter, DctM subunit